MPKYTDTEALLVKIGERIRELRLAKGEPNAEKFALKNDINRVQYYGYEKGKDMQLSSLLKVLNALDTSLPEFFEGF
ncbi:helix-turn-helix domain-containing protein [Mucilaginibacter sp. AW1-3]